MHEYETFAYLDVPKTGSSFISYMLQTYCSEEQLFFKKHKGVENRYDANKFYFISVRDPLDQYISLYSSGCAGGGSLYRRLEKRGYGDFYDSTWKGFRKWLKFVLDPENGKYLGARTTTYAGPLHQILGYQSYRYLELAVVDPDTALANCKTKDDVRQAYKTAGIAKDVVRHETFRDDLKRLVTGRLRGSFANLDDTLDFLEKDVKVNASDRVDQLTDDPTLNRKSRDHVEEREWFLKETFGY